MATITTSQIIDTLKQHLNLSTPEIKEAKPQQPDIEYQPHRAKWEARTALRLAVDPSLPSTPLPAGFPKKLESPLVWEGSDWKDEKNWVYALTPSELDEIAEALKHFQGLDKPLGLVSQATFPLPTLGPVLSGIARELHGGRGFSVLRGIPVDAYSREEVVIIYIGVSSYVGNLRAVQDDNTGGMLAHIKDLSAVYDARAIGSPAYTTDKQVFHTDSGDIISLLALETAAEGGVSKIGSSWRVYNHIAEHRPDLIETLSQPWPYDGFGAGPCTARPLLGFVDGKMIIQYSRRALTGFQGLPRSADIPPISEAHAEALDTLHFLAEKYALSLDFQKGDIQYVNNLSIFHARDGFRDDKENTRHLLRLWLRNEELAWKIPEYLNANWQRLYYSLDPEKQVFVLEPEMRSVSKGVKY